MKKQFISIICLFVLSIGISTLNAVKNIHEEMHMAIRNNCDRMWRTIVAQKNLEAPDEQSAPEVIADYTKAYQKFMIDCIKKYSDH